VSALERVASALDGFAERTGRAISWLTLVLALTGFLVVVMRYVFNSGWIWMQESLTWMHSLVFMLGAAYTLKHDEQVRVDVIYRSLSERRRAFIDLTGTVLFLLPLCGYIFYESLPYLLSSWSVGERSREASGLPALYLLKAILPLMAALLIVQGLAQILRSLTILRRVD
jgi:TRAP-type mannitol/chloroaromatic compound transport system permease small subunit